MSLPFSVLIARACAKQPHRPMLAIANEVSAARKQKRSGRVKREVDCMRPKQAGAHLMTIINFSQQPTQ